MYLFDTMLAPHAVGWDDPDFMGASLDHCMWFHRPLRADEWIADVRSGGYQQERLGTAGAAR